MKSPNIFSMGHYMQRVLADLRNLFNMLWPF